MFYIYIWLEVGCGNTIYHKSKGQRNQLHTSRRARERGRTVTSCMVLVYLFYKQRGIKTSCLATKCLHANYLVVTIKIY